MLRCIYHRGGKVLAHPNFKRVALTKPQLYAPLSTGLTGMETLERMRFSILDKHDGDAAQMDDFDSDEPVEMDPTHVMGREMLKLGHVPYHQVVRLPPWVEEKQNEISDHRTKNQIRRCLKTWMLKPDRDLQKDFAFRKIGWHQTSSKDPSKQKPVMVYGPEETIAYSHYFMPARFGLTRRIFSEVQRLLPNFNPTRVVDFGCGPGTALAAAIDTFSASAIKKYAGVDMSVSMLDAAKIMAKDCGVDCSFYDKTSPLVIKANTNPASRFDVAIASFTLSEMPTDPQRRAAVQILYELLDENGLLIIVEAGSPLGSHTVRSARQFLLDNFNASCLQTHDVDGLKNDIRTVLPPPGKNKHSDFAATVIAPCTHDKPCPLAAGTWCAFSQRVVSSAVRNNSEEKLSYVIIQKRVNRITELNSDDIWLEKPGSAVSDDDEVPPTPMAILNELGDLRGKKLDAALDRLTAEHEFEEFQPPLYREEYGRLVRSPIKNKGHVVLDICTSAGTIDRQTWSKGGIVEIPSLYHSVRKCSWGGLVPVYQVSPENRPSPVLKTRTATRDLVREQQEEIIQEMKLKKERERAASVKVTNAPPIELTTSAKKTTPDPIKELVAEVKRGSISSQEEIDARIKAMVEPSRAVLKSRKRERSSKLAERFRERHKDLLENDGDVKP